MTWPDQNTMFTLLIGLIVFCMFCLPIITRCIVAVIRAIKEPNNKNHE